MNPGKRFEQKFRESMPPGAFVMRIPDKLYMLGGRLMSEESEGDFIVATGSDTFLIECKATNKKSLQFYNVKEHQELSLACFDGVGENTHGLLAVEFYDKDGYRKPKRMFLMPIGEWLRFKAGTSRKSMPISEFERSGVEVPFVGSRYAVDFGRWSR